VLSRFIVFFAVASTLTACIEQGGQGDGPDGVLRVRLLVDAPGIENGSAAILDVSAFDELACERFGSRGLWVASGDAVEVAVPCHRGAELANLRVEVAGAYASVPDDIGRYDGDAPWSPLSFATVIDSPTPLSCPRDPDAGPTTVPVRLGMSGYVDVAVHADSDGLGHGWIIETESHDATVVDWSRQVSTRIYGNGLGGVSYVGPCGFGAPGEAAPVTVTVSPALGVAPVDEASQPSEGFCCGVGVCMRPTAGLNLEGLGQRDPEFWPTTALRREVDCVIDQDTFVPFGPVSLARVERGALGTRAGFGRQSCAASWNCDGAPALSFSCTADPMREFLDDVYPDPVLALDDVVLRCPSRGDVHIDPTADATLREDVIEDRTLLTWTVRPDLDPSLVEPGCTLVARGTSALADGRGLSDGVIATGVIPAGAVYPVITWDIPASWATVEGCQPAHLSTSGPIGVTYTSPDATEDRVFAHRSSD